MIGGWGLGKNQKSLTVRELSLAAGLALDDTLIALWTHGIWEPEKENSRIPPKDIAKAKDIVGLVDPSSATKVSFWLEKLSMSFVELEAELAGLGVKLSPNSRRLPKHALSKLNRRFPKVAEGNETAEVVIQEAPIREHIGLPTWPTNHHSVSNDIRYLKVEQVFEIFKQLDKDYMDSDDPVSTPGLTQPKLLSSALESPRQAQEKYFSPALACSATVYSLIKNHAFPNGNKRTALISLLVMLDENGLQLTEETTEEDLFGLVYRIAASELLESPIELYSNTWKHELLEIAQWIQTHSQIKRQQKMRELPWRVLRATLIEFGCTVVPKANNKVKISRQISSGSGFFARQTVGSYSFTVSQDGMEVDKGVIATIRGRLHLDEDHGVTTAKFYSRNPTLPSEFIQRYSGLIRRLARF